MLRRALLSGALGALALLAASACTPTVATQARPALAELDAPLRRIAVMPFAASPLLRGEEGGTPPRVAAQLVAKFLAEALAARGIEVIAPEDVAATLAGGIRRVARRRFCTRSTASMPCCSAT